jgi:hypothetical protein
LEGAASAGITDVGPTAPSPPADEGLRPEPQLESQTVYALELAGRNLYCNSAFCVSTLIAKGWRLSNPRQLTILVQELATGRVVRKHDPSDHFE